jgi:hypothetical protein
MGTKRHAKNVFMAQVYCFLIRELINDDVHYITVLPMTTPRETFLLGG